MRYITVVGSQQTPTVSCDLIRDLTARATRMGFGTRSGGAVGSDTAAERGVRKGLVEMHYAGESQGDYIQALRTYLRVYLPYQGFNGRNAHALSPFIVANQLPTWEKAKEMVLTIHPNPTALLNKPSYLWLHARNMYQVLGDDLESPSIGLLCYAPPTPDGYVKGGTRSAFKLAKDRGIPCFNVYQDSAAQDYLMFLTEHHQPNVPSHIAR